MTERRTLVSSGSGRRGRRNQRVARVCDGGGSHWRRDFRGMRHESMPRAISATCRGDGSCVARSEPGRRCHGVRQTPTPAPASRSARAATSNAACGRPMRLALSRSCWRRAGSRQQRVELHRQRRQVVDLDRRAVLQQVVAVAALLARDRVDDRPSPRRGRAFPTSSARPACETTTSAAAISSSIWSVKPSTFTRCRLATFAASSFFFAAAFLPVTTTSSIGVSTAQDRLEDLRDRPDAEPAGQLQHDRPAAGDALPLHRTRRAASAWRRPGGSGCR